MANIYGRQVVVPLTNKSGGGVIAGDVVIVDTSNNEAFTTTTTPGYTGGVGIAQETIANNATGRVLLEGYAALVLTSASVTRGNYGKTHTVAKQAVDAGASRGAGTFCQFLTGGTTPTARLFPPDLAAAAGNVASDAIWDAAGDLVQGTGADTAAKLSLGSAGTAVVSTGSTNAYGFPYGSVLACVYIANAANYTTTSTTQADLDATIAITFTAPASGNVLVEIVAAVTISAAVQNGLFGLRESTTNLVNAPTGTFAIQGVAAAASERQVAWAAKLTGISAGSHTYKMSSAVNGGASFTVRSFVGAPIMMKVTSLP